MNIPQASLVAWLALVASVAANLLPWFGQKDAKLATVETQYSTLNDRLNAQATRLAAIGAGLDMARDRNDKVQEQINALAISSLRQLNEATRDLSAKNEEQERVREARSRQLDAQISALTTQVGIVVEQVGALKTTVERLIPQPLGKR